MPFDHADHAARAAALNARFRHHAATGVMRAALTEAGLGRIALVSSFGAESVVLLHMLSVIDRNLPVLFIDTQMLFPETLDYQADLAARLGLSDIRIVRASEADLAAADPANDLHQRDSDACCNLRKTVPLERALGGFDAWITGRKRFQGGTRADLEFFEPDPAGARIKINPLAHWASDDIQDYIANNQLPRHPLVARGYPSIGCAPCTSPVGAGEDARAGRWRGQEKSECGIHFVDGKMVRGPIETPAAAPEDAAAAPLAPAQSPEIVPDGPVIVRDGGFGGDDWTGAVEELASDADLNALLPQLINAPMIRIAFPSFADGRGLTLARRLRMAGYDGRLRAAGHVIADQYAMIRRVGFDEVEIDADLARRQPWPQWQARADWRGGYLGRLGMHS